MNVCPDRKQLQGLIDEVLSDPELRALDVHLETCSICRDELDRLTQDAAAPLLPAAAEPAKYVALQRHPEGDPGEALKPGAQPVPDYVLEQLLGRGGFGEVWKAIAPGGVHVALKFIRLGDQTGAVERRALNVMKDIRHPNLLSIFATWEVGPFLIIGMELADRSLLDRLHEVTRAGRLGIPWPELLEYMREAAKGIDYLNELGIQHRDIKPDNLLLVGGGIRVADFGLAKLLEHSVTRITGAATPAYAAPEFFHEAATTQSDQYSLAVTYCHLRGGRFPFESSLAHVMRGHLEREPDLTMLREAERAPVARALAKDPKARCRNCRAFVEALAASASPRPAEGRASSDGPRTVAPPALAPEIINSIGMKLVLIPPGRFVMGSPPKEDGHQAEEEQHRVEITKAYYLGAYPVTQAEYRLIMKDNPSWFCSQGGGKN
jgi:serine/threonine protein kinase